MERSKQQLKRVSGTFSFSDSVKMEPDRDLEISPVLPRNSDRDCPWPRKPSMSGKGDRYRVEPTASPAMSVIAPKRK
jgi:hypothetical protein